MAGEEDEEDPDPLVEGEILAHTTRTTLGVNKQGASSSCKTELNFCKQRKEPMDEEENELDIPCSGPTSCFSPPEWQVVCNQQAAEAGEQFFRRVCDSLLLPSTAAASLPPDLTAEHLIHHFVASLSTSVHAQLAENQIDPNSPLTDHIKPHPVVDIGTLGEKVSNGATKGESEKKQLSNGNLSDNSDPELEHSGTLKQRTFFRRFSFKGITKGKALNFFHRAGSDEVELGPGGLLGGKERKGRSTKTVVECKREGLVSLMLGDGLDTPGTWEKCRMTLVKAAGGFMLEFFSPPKTSKPKTGVFCISINEARETTALEMPDKEATFVLRVEGQQEFIIEASDVSEMRCWLIAIQACMSPHRGVSPHGAQHPPGPLDTTPSMSDRLFRLGLAESQSMFPLSGRGNADFPGLSELPSRLGGDLADSRPGLPSASSLSSVGPGEGESFPILTDYPWFHGTLSRSEAAAMVLHHSTSGHGVFLVRQSETRKGEFVLTFNFQGRAKHLRLTLNPDGQCRVQHLWFTTVFHMLDHFRVQPIPLESGGLSDCTLTEFAVRTESTPLVGAPTREGERTGAHSLPEPHEVLTLGGSVRRRIGSLEVLTGDGNSSGSSGRAKENTYSFV